MPNDSPNSRFLPHVTVATVIEKDGKYLMVEETGDDQTVLNQPAGHLEENETLAEAAIRETLEETAWEIRLTGVLGTSLYTSSNNGISYYRTTFIAEALRKTQRILDPAIIRALWLSAEEIKSHPSPPRSPLVLQDISKHQRGVSFSLDLIG